MGTANGIYTKEFVEYMRRDNPDIHFDIFTNDIGEYGEYYKKIGSKVYVYPDFGEDTFELNWKRKLVIRKLRERYDYIQLFVVRYNTLKFANLLAGNKSKIVISYWDLWLTSYEKKKIKPYLSKVYKINFLTENLEKDFVETYGNKYNNKFFKADLVMSNILRMEKWLDKHSLKKLAIHGKKQMGFPADKVVIAVGYCGRKDQQHIRVLNQILEMSDECIKNMYIFVHVGYGVRIPAYINQIEMVGRKIRARGGEFVISDEFMTGNRLSWLRFGVDIFINAELIDALSGSMLEYFAAGTNVINGAWLDYIELEKYKFKYTKFNEFVELKDILTKKMIQLKRDVNNPKLVFEHFSWKKNSKIWNDIYK